MRGSELNGDIRLSPGDRIRYLAGNLGRNVRRPAGSVATRLFCGGRVTDADGVPSPGRFLAHSFIHEELPRLLPQRDIRVLDVGCGSGRMSRLLSQAGFGGTYVGVDVGDRFLRDVDEPEKFVRRFILGDAHDLPESETFDLVFSNSALEHILDDRRLLAKLSRLVAPGGLQVHVVPSGWGLPLYLWHGYRQYPLSRISDVFPAQPAPVYRLGGLGCFLLHFLFVSIGEILLRVKLRARFPRVYRALLRKALVVDRVLGTCPSMYIVCLSAPHQSDGPVATAE